jgi:hypothetical protein
MNGISHSSRLIQSKYNCVDGTAIEDEPPNVEVHLSGKYRHQHPFCFDTAARAHVELKEVDGG